MGSVSSFPRANAQVCRKPSRRLHESLEPCSLFCVTATVVSPLMYSNSAAESFLCLAGTSYIRNQKINQMKPNDPVRINVHCQPQCSFIQGTDSGAMMAPILA